MGLHSAECDPKLAVTQKGRLCWCLLEWIWLKLQS